MNPILKGTSLDPKWLIGGAAILIVASLYAQSPEEHEPFFEGSDLTELQGEVDKSEYSRPERRALTMAAQFKGHWHLDSDCSKDAPYITIDGTSILYNAAPSESIQTETLKLERYRLYQIKPDAFVVLQTRNSENTVRYMGIKLFEGDYVVSHGFTDTPIEGAQLDGDSFYLHRCPRTS